MAKKIYIGNMIQDLQSSIADLQTDMGTMSTNMANMVSELVNVKSVVSAGVAELNIESGDTQELITNIANIPFTGSTQVCEFVSKANGTVKFSFSYKAGSAYGAPNRRFKVYVSRNGVNSLIFDSGDIITASLKDYLNNNCSFIVGLNETVIIRVGDSSYPCIAGSLIYANAKLSYTKVDIVNDGAFIFL